MSVKITGASDDLIEIEGDVTEEFNWISDDDEKRYLAFSDGTLLRVRYDSDGIWRFHLLFRGSAKFEKVDGSVGDDTNDIVTLSGTIIAWVMMGDSYATR